MDLLSFARGPALAIALVAFGGGVVWRICAIALLRIGREHSRPRHTVTRSMMGGMIATMTRSWPHPEFLVRTGPGEALGYSYHMGLFIVVLLYAPHITFLSSLLGFSWPGLPNNVITVVAVLTFTLLLAVLFRRVATRVMRMLSNFDDYFTWFIVTSVIVTGLLATAHIGAGYSTLLGIHILSFDLMLIWFPFSKLMHAFYIFPSRALNGALLTRKGASS